MIKESYAKFGPSLATDMLAEHQGFKDRGGPCTLLVFIGDTISTLMELHFVTSERTFSYFEIC